MSLGTLNDTAADHAVRAAIRGVLLPGFTGIEEPAWLAELLADGLAGVCLFGGNIVSEVQVRELTAALRRSARNLLVAIDEEGGDVTRLHARLGSPYPGNAVLGRFGEGGLAEATGFAVGRELRSVGCNLDFGPVLDVNSNPRNPVIGTRSFGTDPALVGRLGAAWARGLQSSGVAACPKHFPGHGDTEDDSHLSMPVVRAAELTVRERELLPFRDAVRAGARAVMTSHVLVPSLDPDHAATFSPWLLGEVLRGELGFDGVIVTDALDMHGASGEWGIPEAAVRALAAGCDLLCLGTDNTPEQIRGIEEHVARAVREGRLPAARLADAARRVAALAASLASDVVSEGLTSGGIPLSAPEDMVQAFEISSHAAEWLGRRPRYSVLRIDTVTNLAVGEAPWGPFAEAEADPGEPRSKTFTARPQRTVGPGVELPSVGPGEAVLVIGRGLHRHAFAREAVDELRAAGADVLVVEMGWPGPEGYADLLSFSSTRAAGRAVLALLCGEVDPTPTPTPTPTPRPAP